MLTPQSLEKLSRTIKYDVNVFREQVKFVTSVYRKPISSGVYTHFVGFLPDNYKTGMIYTLINRYNT